MQPLSLEALTAIAEARGITYEQITDDDPLVVRSRLSKAFPVNQQDMFEAFADPVAHVKLFQIISSSTPAIREGIEGVLPANTFFAFEHVQESTLPPRIMLVKYTLEPPFRITKEAITDPFGGEDVEVMDKKKGLVIMDFERVSDAETIFTTSSTFKAESGSIFARGFIDRVWFNFFERMMYANGQLTEAEFLT